LANKEWKKGQKRPHNAALKTLCWKIGESFVKVKARDDAYYGHVYTDRRALEDPKNAAKEYADQAAAVLEKKRIGKDKGAYAKYSEGFLPDGHMFSRSKRYAVKLFLSHYFEVGFELHHGFKPPRPYVFDVLGHADYLEPPF